MESGRTTLYQKHIDLKAKMAPFAGFDMPLQYSGVKDEVNAVRSNMGVFDVSHMGEFFVEGKDAIDFVDFIICNDFKNAGPHKAVYSPLLRDNGTVIDDLIAYRLTDTKVLICMNAANIEKDWNWISSKTEGFDINLTNQSSDYSLLAIQGPKTAELLKSLEILPADLDFPYYSSRELSFNSEDIILARTGYTGEDGFELFCSHSLVEKLWDTLMERGVAPCGLVARDVLRLEVCFPLYGHELNDEITPLDAALKWTVKQDKPKFIGQDALKDYDPKWRLVKLSLDKGIPREGYPVLNEEQTEIGTVVSGTMSVTKGFGIAMARVKKDLFPKNKKLFIKVRQNIIEANYHAKPFHVGGHK